MIGAVAKASLFDATTENDFTLFTDGVEYFGRAANRVGPYREFLHVRFHDEDVIDDLQTGDVRAKFLVMAEALAMRWGDEFVGEIVLDQGE